MRNQMPCGIPVERSGRILQLSQAHQIFTTQARRFSATKAAVLQPCSLISLERLRVSHLRQRCRPELPEFLIKTRGIRIRTNGFFNRGGSASAVETGSVGIGSKNEGRQQQGVTEIESEHRQIPFLRRRQYAAPGLSMLWKFHRLLQESQNAISAAGFTSIRATEPVRCAQSLLCSAMMSSALMLPLSMVECASAANSTS